MSAPLNLDKSNKPAKKHPYRRVVGLMIIIVVIAGIFVYLTSTNDEHPGASTQIATRYPTGTTTSTWPTTNPTPTCPPNEKSYDGLGEDEGTTLCFTPRQWTIYQNMVDGKQKAADHKFIEAFKATGMSSRADRQGFAVDYRCDSTIYEKNSASAAFSNISSMQLMRGTAKDSSDFIVLRHKACGYPTSTTPPSTTTLAPKCPPSTSDPACHSLPPGSNGTPRFNPPSVEPKAPMPSTPATGDPLG